MDAVEMTKVFDSSDFFDFSKALTIKVVNHSADSGDGVNGVGTVTWGSSVAPKIQENILPHNDGDRAIIDKIIKKSIIKGGNEE